MRQAAAICVAAATALAGAAGDGGAGAPSSPAAPGLLDGGLLDESAVPVLTPTIMDRKPPARRAVLITEGTGILDRRASLRRKGYWRTIADPQAEELYLLPCELLETTEAVQDRSPQIRFELSGEVYHYRGRYFLMLRRVMQVLAARPPEPQPPPEQPSPEQSSQPASGPVGSATTSGAASRPARGTGASADDVAKALLSDEVARPVRPVRRAVARAEIAPSVAPTSRPLPPGPGRMVVHRLGRLVPPAAPGEWPLLVFESDNTLREPPLPILPNEHLQEMERLSDQGRAAGTVFHVSGEIHQYRRRQYLLVRSAMKKRDLDLF